MRKLYLLLLAITLSVVMLAATVVPAIASTPAKLTFSTGLACDDSPMMGSLDAGFMFIPIGTSDILREFTLIFPEADPGIEDGLYPFYLQSNPVENAKLIAYFEAKWKGSADPTEQAYLAQITEEINGEEPFFYLKAESGAYTLVDGFVYGLSGYEGQTLRINNDYPAGNYLYSGTLVGTNDAELPVNVKLKVFQFGKNIPNGAVKVNLYNWAYDGTEFGASVLPVVGSATLNALKGQLSILFGIDDGEANLVDYDAIAFVFGMDALGNTTGEWSFGLVRDVINTNDKGKCTVMVKFDLDGITDADWLVVIFGTGEEFGSTPAKYVHWALVQYK